MGWQTDRFTSSHYSSGVPNVIISQLTPFAELPPIDTNAYLFGHETSSKHEIVCQFQSDQLRGNASFGDFRGWDGSFGWIRWEMFADPIKSRREKQWLQVFSIRNFLFGTLILMSSLFIYFYFNKKWMCCCSVIIYLSFKNRSHNLLKIVILRNPMWKIMPFSVSVSQWSRFKKRHQNYCRLYKTLKMRWCFIFLRS